MKIFHVILAIVLIIACATNSVAAQNGAGGIILSQEVFIAAPNMTTRPIIYEKGKIKEPIIEGSTLYFTIENVVRAEDIAGYNPYTGDWTAGEEFIGTPKIQYKMMYNGDESNPLGYRYVVALPILNLAGEKSAIIDGKVGLGQRWSAASKNKITAKIVPNSNEASREMYTCEGNYFPISFETTKGKALLTFENYAQFEIDVTGQGDLDVGITTSNLTDIEAKYPGQLKYVRWTQKPIFNRLGKLKIFINPDEYVYKVKGDDLVMVTGHYIEDEKAFVIETMILEEYAISKKALKAPLEVIPNENPLTGANINE